jgi:hypothetical protein
VKTASLRLWILSCGSKSGLASAVAARAARIESLAWRSSRRSAWSDWPWKAGSGREEEAAEEVAVEGGEEAEVPRAVEVPTAGGRSQRGGGCGHRHCTGG